LTSYQISDQWVGQGYTTEMKCEEAENSVSVEKKIMTQIQEKQQWEKREKWRRLAHNKHK